MAKILKGAAVTAAMDDKTRGGAEALRARGITPSLAILRVGDREDDVAYERSAMRRCAAAGVAVKNVTLPADIPQDLLIGEVEALNADSGVHGVLILRPLPGHIDDSAVRRALCPEKDVDGITDGSLAGVFTGSGAGFAPCTAQACMEILDFYGVDIAGRRAVVIGRSLVVGKPVAVMLTGRHATVTVCHTRTADMPSVTRAAEILVVAAGRAGAIDGKYLSPGQTVIDVGINWDGEAGRLVGDVNAKEAEEIVAAVTPVPGGVGTVTTSVLISHVVEAAKRAAKTDNT